MTQRTQTSSRYDAVVIGGGVNGLTCAAHLGKQGVRTVLVGTVMWAVAFVVLLLLRNQLEESGRQWWLWTCVAGVGLGLLGYEYTRRRRDAIRRVRQYQHDHPGDPEGDATVP